MKISEVGKEIMELKEEMSSLITEVDNLKAWQNKQNGSIQKLEEKIDKLTWYLTTLLGGVAVSLFLEIISILKK